MSSLKTSFRRNKKKIEMLCMCAWMHAHTCTHTHWWQVYISGWEQFTCPGWDIVLYIVLWNAVLRGNWADTQKDLYIIFKTSCSVILMTVQMKGPNGTLGLENEIIGNCTPQVVFPLCSCCGTSCPPWVTGAIALGPCFLPSFPFLHALATEEMSHNWTICPDQSSLSSPGQDSFWTGYSHLSSLQESCSTHLPSNPSTPSVLSPSLSNLHPFPLQSSALLPLLCRPRNWTCNARQALSSWAAPLARHCPLWGLLLSAGSVSLISVPRGLLSRQASHMPRHSVRFFSLTFQEFPLSLLPTRPLLWGKKFDPLQPQFGEILMSPWLLFAELPPLPPSPRPWDEQCPHAQSLVQVFGRVKPRTFQGKDCVWFQFVDNPLESSSLQILTRNASVEVHLVSLNKLIQLIRKSYPTTIIYY